MRKWALLFLIAGAALGQGQEKRMVKAFTEMVKRAGIKQCNLVMQEGFMQWLSSEPDEALQVCAAAAKYVRKSVDRFAADWEELAGKLVKLGEWTAAANGQDAAALGAHAEALRCRARLNDDPTRNPDVEDWKQAAELFLKADGIDADEGNWWERAVRTLSEGANSTAGTPELRERAGALAEQGAKHYRKNEYFREFAHKAKLAKITELLAQDRKQAKAMLAAYLNRLQPQAANPGAFSPTFFNDAVTLAKREKKLGVKAKYRTRVIAYGGRMIEFDVPEGRRWKWKGSRLYQYDTDGRLLRTLNFRTYRWTTEYQIDGRGFGGDNLKGLARGGEIDVLGVIRKITNRKNLRRKRLNRFVPQTQVFTIGGLDEDGDYLCYHCYYFKAKKTKMRTVGIMIVELGKFKKLDPEAQLVMDSIREP